MLHNLCWLCPLILETGWCVFLIGDWSRRQNAANVARYVFFLRFQILFLLALVLLPFCAEVFLPGSFDNLMVFDDYLGPAMLSFVVLSACWVCMVLLLHCTEPGS
jgi:hypothetical protein